MISWLLIVTMSPEWAGHMFVSTMSEVRFRSPVVLRSNSAVRMTQNAKKNCPKNHGISSDWWFGDPKEPFYRESNASVGSYNNS